MDKTSIMDFEAEAKKLRKYFKFTEDDLAINRTGVLSEKQKERIREEVGGTADRVTDHWNCFAWGYRVWCVWFQHRLLWDISRIALGNRLVDTGNSLYRIKRFQHAAVQVIKCARTRQVRTGRDLQ